MALVVNKEFLGFGKTVKDLPAGAIVRHVHEQHGRFAIWYQCSDDMDMPLQSRTFFVIATGQPIPVPDDLGLYPQYHGTIHLPDKTVWHVYEVASNGH